MSTEVQNGKNTTFLALLDCFMHWSRLNSDLKHLLKDMFLGGGGGLICQKQNQQINENFEKWSKISNQIWSQV